MSNDYKKNDKYRQELKFCTKNYARKRCPPNQLNIKLITKNKKTPFAFFKSKKFCKSNDAHYCDTVRREQKPTKRGKYAKITKNGFMKTCCSKKKDPLRKLKPF